MSKADRKTIQICIAPKEILLWRQPLFSILCYFVLYYSIGLLESQSVVTVGSLLLLVVLVAEVVAKEVFLRIFDKQLEYTTSLDSRPMSPLSRCIQGVWEGVCATHLALGVVACLLAGLLLSQMDSLAVLSTLLTVVMVGPAAYYGSRYSHLAQAVAHFSMTICQPGLLEDDEEDDLAGTKEEMGSYKELFSEEQEESTKPGAELPCGGVVQGDQVSLSRRSSSESLDLGDFDVISTQEVHDSSL